MLGWALISLFAARPWSRPVTGKPLTSASPAARIAQLGGTMAGADELAADGLLALPGGVDAHTHLVHQGLRDRLKFPIWVDDFWSGSRAAIAGGITTIGNMTYPAPGDDGTDGDAERRDHPGDGTAPRREAAVDWFLHPILVRPRRAAGRRDRRPRRRRAREHQDVPVRPGPRPTSTSCSRRPSAAKAAGSVTLLHCEDGAMLSAGGREADGGGPRRGRELPRGPPGRRRGGRGRPGHRHRPPHRRARLHRAPVVRRRA